MYRLSIPGDLIHMLPAVPFADPGEPLAAVQPVKVVHYLHPGTVAVGENGFDLPAGSISQQHPVGVLQAIEVLDDHFIRIVGPVHPGDIVVAGISRDVQPAGFATGGIDHSHPTGRIGGAYLGILHRDHLRINRIGIVDHVKYPDSRGIELPVGN